MASSGLTSSDNRAVARCYVVQLIKYPTNADKHSVRVYLCICTDIRLYASGVRWQTIILWEIISHMYNENYISYVYPGRRLYLIRIHRRKIISHMYTLKDEYVSYVYTERRLYFICIHWKKHISHMYTQKDEYISYVYTERRLYFLSLHRKTTISHMFTQTDGYILYVYTERW